MGNKLFHRTLPTRLLTGGLAPQFHPLALKPNLSVTNNSPPIPSFHPTQSEPFSGMDRSAHPLPEGTQLPPKPQPQPLLKLGWARGEDAQISETSPPLSLPFPTAAAPAPPRNGARQPRAGRARRLRAPLEAPRPR